MNLQHINGALFFVLMFCSNVFALEPLPACAELHGKPIRWLVPSPPGGGYDAYSRLVQPFLEQALATRIQIENRPEAGGVVAAIAIRDAAPDGTTLGLVNASGLLAAFAVNQQSTPDPVKDFTVLAQLVSNHSVLFTGRDSGITDMAGLVEASQSGPMVVAVRDAGSASFYAVPVTASLLGIDYALVSGYVGTSARVMALLRGDVDVLFANYGSVESQVRSGEMLPLLQLNPSAADRLDIPRLNGPDGLARARAALTGRSMEQAQLEADELAAIVGAGRLVFAPAGLPPNITQCLETALADVIQDPAFVAAARRAHLLIEYQDSAMASQGLLAGRRGVEHFQGLIQAAIRQTRE